MVMIMLDGNAESLTVYSAPQCSATWRNYVYLKVTKRTFNLFRSHSLSLSVILKYTSDSALSYKVIFVNYH
jgi:hypothetical protein